MMDVSIVVCLFVHTGLTLSRANKDLNRALSATWNLAVVCFALVECLNPAAFFVRYAPMPSSLTIAVYNECIFYVVHFIEEVLFKDVIYALHHAGALLAITGALVSGYTQPMLIVFGVFTASSPFLYISKWAHHNRMDALAKTTFTLFSGVFFAFRIVLYPMVLKFTYIDALYLPDLHMGAYVLCNTILGALYLLQWYWFTKIMRVLRLHVH